MECLVFVFFFVSLGLMEEHFVILMTRPHRCCYCYRGWLMMCNVYIVLCLVTHMYTNFLVLLLFQIKIRITPVARAMHTQKPRKNGKNMLNNIKNSNIIRDKVITLMAYLMVFLNLFTHYFATFQHTHKPCAKKIVTKNTTFSQWHTIKIENKSKKNSFQCKCTKRCEKKCTTRTLEHSR